MKAGPKVAWHSSSVAASGHRKLILPLLPVIWVHSPWFWAAIRYWSSYSSVRLIIATHVSVPSKSALPWMKPARRSCWYALVKPSLVKSTMVQSSLSVKSHWLKTFFSSKSGAHSAATSLPSASCVGVDLDSNSAILFKTKVKCLI